MINYKKLNRKLKSPYAIGLDIGGTKALIMITDSNGTLIYKEKVKSSGKIHRIVELINDSLFKVKIPINQIIGLGIGVPSATNSNEGIVMDAPALEWVNLNLKKELERHFDFPIYIDNDVNFAALGEKWKGTAKKSNNIFFIAIGTGVGSALILNGALVRGHSYEAGEIAYNISESDINEGIYNELGEFGVFESKISGTALSRYIDNPKQLFKMYTEDNGDVKKLINNFITQISINIVNAVNLVNPEYVVIGGGVSESMDIVLEKIQDSVNELTPVKTTIVLSSLKGDAGALGAIAYVLER